MAGDRCRLQLLRGKELSASEIALLRNELLSKTAKDLRKVASSLSVRLTGSVRKVEIVERLISMAQIGAIYEPASNDNDDDPTVAISYLTNDVKCVLKDLPPFSSVTEWSKNLNGVLRDFTFMNLLIYLVYGREKSFDMQSLKAFKSLKAYKYFYDGYVKNVWVFECPVDNDLNLRVLYFRAFVYHSFTCDVPLEVFVTHR